MAGAGCPLFTLAAKAPGLLTGRVLDEVRRAARAGRGPGGQAAGPGQPAARDAGPGHGRAVGRGSPAAVPGLRPVRRGRRSCCWTSEPTSALDPASTRAVEHALKAFVAAGGTVVIASHDPAQARRIAGRQLMLHAGRLSGAGPAAPAASAREESP
jgi:hypothetical protein